MRNERYRKNAIGVRERHNERKNEAYSNPDVLLEYSSQNVVSKHAVHQHMHSNSTGWLRRES